MHNDKQEVELQAFGALPGALSQHGAQLLRQSSASNVGLMVLREDSRDAYNVQGDIVLGLAKKAQSFGFFAIVDPADFRHALTAHTDDLITTTAEA
jgi:hypothetical protein